MRLPYIQIEADFLSSKATILAAILGIHRALAVGLGVELFAFAVTATSTRDTPPDGLLMDPDAATIIEAAVGWTGEAGRFCAALVRAGMAEKLEIGIRIRGLDRYASAWKKAEEDRARKTKKGAANSDGIPSESAATSTGKPSEKSGQTQTQTQTQKEATAATAHMVWQAQEWEARFAAPASPPPLAEFLAWFTPALADVVRLGRTEEDLRTAYRAFLADPFWSGQTRRRCPWAGWVKQWKDFLPKRVAGPPEQEFRTVEPGEDIYAEDAA